MLNLTVKTKIAGGFVVCVLLVCLIGAFCYYSINKYEAAFVRVEHTHEVIRTADIAIISVLNAEIKIRGYIASSDTIFLSKYENAYRNAIWKTEALRRLVSDNPLQARRMDTLKALVDKQYKMSKEIFINKEPFKTISDSLLVRKKNLDEIRRIYPIITNAEEQLLIKRKALSIDSSRKARIAISAGAVISLTVILLLLYYIMLSFKRQKKNEAHIKLLNDRFSLISKATRDALFEWNLETVTAWWSESHFSMFGFNSDEGVPSKEAWLMRLHPSGIKTIEDMLSKVSDPSFNEWQDEVTYFRPDGTAGTLLARAFVIRNNSSQPKRILGSFIDITDRKNEELQKAFFSEISILFGQPLPLNEILQQVLVKLTEYSGLTLAEVWLTGSDKNRISLIARHSSNETMRSIFDETEDKKTFIKGEGLIGQTWDTGDFQFWRLSEDNDLQTRKDAAARAGLKTVVGLPLFYNTEIIGVLMLGLNVDGDLKTISKKLQGDLNKFLGAEIKRKQMEQELYQIFHFAPDIICIIDAEGNFKKVNSAMCDLLEFTEAELLNYSLRDLVHPDDFNNTARHFLKRHQQEPILRYENRCLSKTGQHKFLSWTSRQAVEKDLFFCVAKDITEKKELEKLLLKATTLARIGSWEVDLIKGSVYWSDITREIHELSPEYVPNLEEGIEFYRTQETRQYISQKVNDAIQHAIPFDEELQIVTAKGNVKWVRSIGEPEICDGRCIKLAGSFQDITLRKKAEIAAKNALEERNRILESIDDAFFALNTNWIVTYWNNMAEKVMDRLSEEIVGKNFWEEFPLLVNSESYIRYHQSMQLKQALRFECHHDNLKWYEVSTYPSENGLSIYIKDVTERKVYENNLAALNENLKRQAKELSISNAELEQFAYVASHDLQEPLRMVTSFLSQLEKKYNDVIDERGKKYIYFAVDGAKRMRQIILDLLEFSRVGSLAGEPEKIEVKQVITEIMALFRNEIKEKGAQITYQDLPEIVFHKTPLRQILQNLIGNSLKYQKPKATPFIEITAEEKDTVWLFSVKDNGIGIDPEYFQKIFIIFQRLHNKDDYAGTGMGLAITKKIVENFGGRIWVESREGRGSIFYFTISKHL